MSSTTPGLRERKKARTRWAIQEHALRLFAEQGYEATTVDQIAAAAEISPSTFFRYFPTKEDVVVQDEYDDIFIAAFARTATISPATALRSAVVTAIERVDQHEWQKSMDRARLILSEPALRARSLDNAMTMAARAITLHAASTGRDPKDPVVLVQVGACLGVFAAVALSLSADDDPQVLIDRLTAALDLLEPPTAPDPDVPDPELSDPDPVDPGVRPRALEG